MPTQPRKWPRSLVLRAPGPSEHDIQRSLFTWAKLACREYPEVRLLFAIPNDAKRSLRAAAWHKAQGLRAGVPDVCLPVARKGYGSLWLEHKAAKGRTTEAQDWWLLELAAAGNLVVVSRSFEESRKAIVDYLS